MLITALAQVRAKANFIHQFLRHPRATGSITPSSAALCRTMCNSVNWQSTSHIAELGAGDGVLTRHLLREMPPEARLDAWEISPSLATQLASLNDPRLTVHQGSAEHLAGSYQAIFSGLPLLSLPAPLRRSLLDAVAKALAPGGVFIQFQYTTLVQNELERNFRWQRQRVLKNLPPAWVYRCQLR